MAINLVQPAWLCLDISSMMFQDLKQDQLVSQASDLSWYDSHWGSMPTQEIQWETRAKVEVGEWLPNCLHRTRILSEQCLNWRNNSLSPSYIVVTHWISNRGLIDSILLILDGPTLDVSTMVTCPKWTMSLPSHDVGHNAHRFYQFYSAKCTNRGRYKYD